MTYGRIDRIDGLNVAFATFEDLEYLVGTGRAISKGTGRYKESSYRRGVETRIGDIEERVWHQLMEQLIDREGEGWLLKDLEDWCSRDAEPARKGELHGYALKLHSRRIFDNEEWVDYIPFNRKYRPKQMEGRKFPLVRFHCDCRAVGEITQAQIKRGNAPCPVCGCFREFDVLPLKRMKEEVDAGAEEEGDK